MPQILIVGATGVLGKMAAHFFIEKGYTVTAFVRNEEKAADLKEKGVIIKQGDLTQPDSMKGICNQIDIVLTAAHSMLGKGKSKSQFVDDSGHLHLINEAKQSGVKHFIFTSVNKASADHPIDFFRTKFKIEQLLINSRLNYTILRLPPFMEWHAYNLLGKSIIEKGKTTIFGKGNKAINFIAVKDVITTINIVAGVEKYYGQTLLVAGPDNITRNQVASLFFKAVNKKEKITHLPITLIKFLSSVFSLFHPGIARIMKLTVYSEQTDNTIDPKQSIHQFGFQPKGIEEFIVETVNKNKIKDEIH